MTWANCCRPYFPVGSWPVHSSFCQIAARQKLSVVDEAEWREFNRIQRDLATAMKAHPSHVETPLRLVQDDGYMDHHSDDEDDAGPRGIA